MPFFELIPLDKQNYTELDLLSEIAHFIIAHNPKQRIRSPVSLNKAHYLLHVNAYSYKWPLSRKTFIGFWAKHAAAAPFHYIERFHSPLSWDLDPNSPEFVASVDDLLNSPNEVRSYLRRSRWAGNQVAARLDGRALVGVRFPEFPDNLPPEPVSPPPVSRAISEAIRSYGKADKYLG